MTSDGGSWQDANQRYLVEQLDVVRAALEAHAKRAGQKDRETAEPTAAPKRPKASDPSFAVEVVCSAFRLSRFERSLLLLCAGMELDARFPAACAAAQGDEQRAFPTFSLALAALPEAHWSALTPAAPLRRWKLVEVTDAASLAFSPLRIDERVLHFLCGINQIDHRLAAVVDAAPQDACLPPSQQDTAKEIVAAWAQSGQGTVAAVQLCGTDSYGKRTVASAACKAAGLGLGVVAAESLPTVHSEIETFVRLWERESVLNRCALLIDCDETERTDNVRWSAVTRVVERLTGVVMMSTRERRGMPQRTLVTLDVGKPLIDEQRTLWLSVLGSSDVPLEELGAQFDVNAQTIRAAAVEARARLSADPDGNGGPSQEDRAPSPADVAQAVWDSCRVQARPRLDDLAQRIVSPAGWDDLILPDLQKGILRDIASHVRRRAIVYERWGFGARGGRGLGISALFAGTSGTGKTMAAEVLANELRLDLYRVDLSSTVSKYIGETEKNLSRIFDAAEEGGAVLLFDEADALFGKRSEVKDSHDRYANIEVSYLLQRMESYRGLAILTTNLKSALDTAFLRRLRFVVQFPFPDAANRSEIWRRIFPPAAPTDSLDLEKLAQLTVSGGNIRNMALNAAFVAADEGKPVAMRHVLRAAQAEYAKLEKTLTDAEIAGW